jgi:hypothetical protein
MSINFDKKQIKEIIKQEINWHTQNKDKTNMPDDWINGFISGLKQINKVFNGIHK